MLLLRKLLFLVIVYYRRRRPLFIILQEVIQQKLSCQYWPCSIKRAVNTLKYTMEETRPLLGVQRNGVEITSKNHNSSGSDENGLQVRLSYQDRKPFTRPSPLLRNNPRSSANVEQSATYNRYRYYSLLHKEKSELVIPQHVLPPELFLVVTKSSDGLGSQSSWVTIFSIWNTMMGTSLLSMPWAISQAGFTCGIFMMIFIAGLSFYTTRQIVHFAAKFSTLKRFHLFF